MTAEDFDAAIGEFDLTLEQAAEHLGIGVRSIYRYISGERPVPGPVALAIRQQQAIRKLVANGAAMIWKA